MSSLAHVQPTVSESWTSFQCAFFSVEKRYLTAATAGLPWSCLCPLSDNNYPLSPPPTLKIFIHVCVQG